MREWSSSVGDHTVRKRLADPGLPPGTVLQIMRITYGPFIVAFKGDVRLALGHGRPQEIRVEPRPQFT